MKKTADGRQQTAASQPETTEDLTDPEEEAKVRRMIERHAEYTESAVARRALNDWHETRGQFEGDADGVPRSAGGDGAKR